MNHREPVVAAFVHLAGKLSKAVRKKERIAAESRGRTTRQFDAALADVQLIENEARDCFRLIRMPDGMERRG